MLHCPSQSMLSCMARHFSCAQQQFAGTVPHLSVDSILHRSIAHALRLHNALAYVFCSTRLGSLGPLQPFPHPSPATDPFLSPECPPDRSCCALDYKRILNGIICPFSSAICCQRVDLQPLPLSRRPLPKGGVPSSIE